MNLQDDPEVEVEVVTGGAIAFELENAARKYIHVYNLILVSRMDKAIFLKNKKSKTNV